MRSVTLPDSFFRVTHAKDGIPSWKVDIPHFARVQLYSSPRQSLKYQPAAVSEPAGWHIIIILALGEHAEDKFKIYIYVSCQASSESNKGIMKREYTKKKKIKRKKKRKKPKED